MEETGWKLAFVFDDQSPSFAHGFACGKLYQKMLDGQSPIEETIISDIAKEVGRFATNQGYRADWEPLGTQWGNITLTKQLNLIQAVK